MIESAITRLCHTKFAIMTITRLVWDVNNLCVSEIEKSNHKFVSSESRALDAFNEAAISWRQSA